MTRDKQDAGYGFGTFQGVFTPNMLTEFTIAHT